MNFDGGQSRWGTVFRFVTFRVTLCHVQSLSAFVSACFKDQTKFLISCNRVGELVVVLRCALVTTIEIYYAH